MADEPKSPLFNNVWYNRVKFIVQLLLPGLSVLYLTLAGIWGLPYGQQISATLAGLAAFLGLFLQISTNRYAKGGGVYDGEIVTAETMTGEPVYAIQFDSREQQEKANSKDVLSLKITPQG